MDTLHQDLKKKLSNWTCKLFYNDISVILVMRFFYEKGDVTYHDNDHNDQTRDT